jgi:hypothetical protein
MDTVSYKATIDVISDAVKILGPAIITAIVSYKIGQSQLLMKIKELNKNNEFKAREKIFDFHKEKLEKMDQSIKSLIEGLGQLAGMTLADLDDKMHFSSFVNKYIILYINGLPFYLKQTYDELKKYSGEFNHDLELLQVYKQRAENLSKPENPEDAQTTIVELIEIHSFVSHCNRILIEKEALEIFKPYMMKS